MIWLLFVKQLECQQSCSVSDCNGFDVLDEGLSSMGLISEGISCWICWIIGDWWGSTIADPIVG